MRASGLASGEEERPPSTCIDERESSGERRVARWRAKIESAIGRDEKMTARGSSVPRPRSSAAARLLPAVALAHAGCRKEASACERKRLSRDDRGLRGGGCEEEARASAARGPLSFEIRVRLSGMDLCRRTAP